MDGRATFTIAMSSTTMNCTPRSNASASHFRRAVAIMGNVLSVDQWKLANLQDALSLCNLPLAERKFQRYNDLAGGLPGIGTNILASRLKDLEEGGIVEKRKLPPPAASTVYELTEYGAGLQEALYALARWGARSLGPPTKQDDLYEDWGL